MAEQRLEKLNQYFIISSIVIVLALIMSFIFSKHLQVLLEHISNTRASNRLLKSKVRDKNKELLKYNEELKSLNENLEYRVQEEVEKNKEKDAQLYEQAKMASMGEMIGNIAHQWRQPLSIISTIASGIKLRHKINQLELETVSSQMDDIIDKTKHLSDTIDTFKNFLIDKRTFDEVVIQDSLNDSINIIESSLKYSNIQLIKDINENEPIKIMTIQNELIQVLINIFHNAKDILIERKIDYPTVHIKLSKVDNMVVIIVEDNAGGIPENIILRIFEPYFTTKHKSQGTGLGLHMSYKIVTESLKGQIYVKNGEKGARFYIQLPLN